MERTKQYRPRVKSSYHTSPVDCVAIVAGQRTLHFDDRLSSDPGFMLGGSVGCGESIGAGDLKENRLENYLGKLVLRLTLGGLLLLHGVAKVSSGPASIMNRVASAGLPTTFGYLVCVGEVRAPLLLIVGLWTRAAALVVAINMVVAVLLVHIAQLGALNGNGGWALELQGFYFLTAVAIMLLGAGKVSVGGASGKLN